MARRLHSSTLGGSRKWAALASDSHRMLYERVIDITDAYGRFDADPVMVKAQAIPRLATSIGEVEAALDDMEQVGLIERWEVDGNPYACIVAFEKFNNLDPAKEAQTTIPGPDGITPTRPARTDRSKPKASPKRTQRKPVASATPDPGKTTAHPGQEVGKPRADDGSELGTLYGYGYEYLDREEELNPPTPLEEPEPPRSEMVEATPRREKPPKSTKPGKNGRALHHEFNPTTIAEELPANFDPELFQAFCSSRLKLKRPMTTEALRQFLRKHEKRPRSELDEMFRAAIVAGWLDLYPPKPRDARDKPNDTTLDQYTERGL